MSEDGISYHQRGTMTTNQTSLTVTFCRGISGSGKSTKAKALAAETGALRLNLDDLRAMFGQPWSKDHEAFVQGQQDKIALAALRSGRSVILDNTTLIPKNAKRFATLCWEENLPVSYAILDTTDVPVDVCIERNAARGADKVPDHVIPRQAKEWAKQVQRGPWTIESITEGLPEIVPVDEHFGAQTAYICDLDGTLAEMNGRSPYEHDKCDQDRVWHHVREVVLSLITRGHTIILCSGRDEQYREKTEAWLAEHGITYDHLYMRPAGDQRRDSVVKLDLFNRFIRGEYDVVAAIDDRKRVVDLWASLGIPVMRVGDPNSDF